MTDSTDKADEAQEAEESDEAKERKELMQIILEKLASDLLGDSMDDAKKSVVQDDQDKPIAD